MNNMINSSLKLNASLFTRQIDTEATKEGWGRGLVIAGEKDERVVVVSADTADSIKSSYFRDKFPERFFQVGVAEQALVTVASGMANYGKIPFAGTYAMFSPGRNWEQIRTTIALNNVPVKLGGSHSGLSDGPDGATHQPLEDIALMRVMPNMTVVVPCDANETEKAVVAIAKTKSPSYIRFGRNSVPTLTSTKSPFVIGKANIFWENKNPQVAIIACGPLVYEALLAAKELEENGVGTIVVNNHTVKPMDEKVIVEVARKTGAVVTVEDHQIAGGMGSAVGEVLAKSFPVPIEFIGMNDSFGESGDPDELLTKYIMKKKDIIEAAKKVLTRKNS